MADDSGTLPQNSSQIETTMKKRPTKGNVESCLSWIRDATTVSSLMLIIFSIVTGSSATGWKYARAPRIGHFGHGRTGPNIFVGRGGGLSTGENGETLKNDALDVCNDDYDDECYSGAVDATKDGFLGSVGGSDKGGGGSNGDSDSTKDATLEERATAPLSEAEGDEIIHDFNAQLRKIRAEIEAEAIREIEGLRMEIAAARKKKAPHASIIQQEEISKDHALQDGRQEEEIEVQEEEEFTSGRGEELGETRGRLLDEHGKSIYSDLSWPKDSGSAGSEGKGGDEVSALPDNFENKVENELEENEVGSFFHAKQSAGMSESEDALIASTPSLSRGQKCAEEGFVVGDTDEDDDEVVEKLRVWEEEEERDQHEVVGSFFTKENNAERADQEEEDEINGEVFHHELGDGEVKSDSELQQDVQPPAGVYDKEEVEFLDAATETKDVDTKEDIAFGITSLFDEGELDVGAVATPVAAEQIDSDIEYTKGDREEPAGIHVVPSQIIGHRTTLSKRSLPESLSTKTSRRKKKRRKKRHKKESAFGKADHPLSERDMHDFQSEGDDNKAFSEEEAGAIEYVGKEVHEGGHHSPLVAFVRNAVFYALLIFLVLVARVALSTVAKLIGLDGFTHFSRQN